MYISRRMSFYGCETGYSMLAIVDSEKNQILQCFLEHFLSPVTVVQLFNIYNNTVEDDTPLSGILKIHIFNYLF